MGTLLVDNLGRKTVIKISDDCSEFDVMESGNVLFI